MKNLRFVMLMLTWSVANAVYAQVKEISSIGKGVSKETSNEWTQRFTQRNPSAVQTHYYQASMFKELLNVQSLAGIFIFNGLDRDGKIHLIFKAADKNGEVITEAGSFDDGATCPPICPGDGGIVEKGSRIEDGIAQQMIERFQNNYAGKVFSHLYGRIVFEKILSQPNVQGIAFSNGVDEKGAEHMVLAGVNKNGEAIDDGGPYNDGATCPPTCPPGYPPQDSFTAKKN